MSSNATVVKLSVPRLPLKIVRASASSASVYPLFVAGSKTKGSSDMVRHPCEFRASETCAIELVQKYYCLLTTYNANDGKIICNACSCRVKRSGRNTEKCKYKTLDDNFFKDIDTLEKAYLLGWIIADGHIPVDGFRIKIVGSDRECLVSLRDIICPDLPITLTTDNRGCEMVTLYASSGQISRDLCRHLKLNFEPGGSRAKSLSVQFPELDSDALRWACVRGIFDGDGCLYISTRDNYPVASVSSISPTMRQTLQDLVGLPCVNQSKQIVWNGSNAIKFLAKLYEGDYPRLRRKYELYLTIADWFPFKSGTRKPFMRYIRICEAAAPPVKSKITGEWYGLTLVKLLKIEDGVYYYDTCLKISSLNGAQYDLCPDKLIRGTGYDLHNRKVVITGEESSIVVALVKTDTSVPDLVLPARVVRLVPKLGTFITSGTIDP